MIRPGAVLVVAAAAAAVHVAGRVREIAEREQRPVRDVLTDLPDLLARDLSTFAEDVREAVDEGRAAAERQMSQLADDLADAARSAADGV